MAEEKFKLPRSSYEELCKIIIAYGKLEKPASLAEVTRLTGINTTGISGNNAFLSSVGIIEGGNLKGITQVGKKLAHALEYGLQDEIKEAWQEIIRDSDFLNKMVLAVGIRKGMESSNLETHIAYSAGQPKNKATMTGARTIIDIILNSGVVTDKDDRIVPAEGITTIPAGRSVQPLKEVPVAEVSKPSGVNLNIDVNINVTTSELEGLAEKLKALMKELSDIGVTGKKDKGDVE